MTSVVTFSMMGRLEKGTSHVWVSLLALYLALSLGICLDKSLSVCCTNYPDKSTWGEQINSTETQQKHCLHKLIPGSVLAAMPTPSSLRRLGKPLLNHHPLPGHFWDPKVSLSKWGSEGRNGSFQMASLLSLVVWNWGQNKWPFPEQFLMYLFGAWFSARLLRIGYSYGELKSL